MPKCLNLQNCSSQIITSFEISSSFDLKIFGDILILFDFSNFSSFLTLSIFFNDECSFLVIRIVVFLIVANIFFALRSAAAPVTVLFKWKVEVAFFFELSKVVTDLLNSNSDASDRLARVLLFCLENSIFLFNCSDVFRIKTEFINTVCSDAPPHLAM